MHLIIGNFGNHSLAALQALVERNIPDLHFVYVDTGWSHPSWEKRIEDGVLYAQKNQIKLHRLKSKLSFSEMVIERKQFPSQKFQWCTYLLKGTAIINFLDEIDPACEALIVSGKRRLDSRRYALLHEFEADNEYYQGRTLWHPLWQTPDEDFIQLIRRAGFEPLAHASLECSPCIHLNKESLINLDEAVLSRLSQLENKIERSMFAKPIALLSSDLPDLTTEANRSLEQFDFGCGSPWGCGE